MTRLKRATRETFSSLRVRNYRLFFTGQLISVTGTWMQWVAQSWLVLKLTHSGVALGTVTALQFIPSLIGGMYAGVLADRFDKRRIIMAASVAAGVLALVLGVLTATGVVELWMVYLLAFLFGIASMIEVPARQSFVTEMVGPGEVPNAVALNTAVFNAGRIVGPAVAAALIASAGLAWAFVLNGISYGAVVYGLAVMNRSALFRDGLQSRVRTQVREGLQYAWRTPELRRVLVIVALVGTFGMNFMVVLPLIAKETFHGDAGTYGLLSSIMAVGSLAGSLTTARRANPTSRLLIAATAALSFTMLVAAFAPTVALEALALVPVGASAMVVFTTANATFQLRTPPFLRGRLMALYTLVFLGGTAIGGPVAGLVSEQLGPRAGFVLGGAMSLVAAVVAWTMARAERVRADEAAAEVETLSFEPAVAEVSRPA
jgi:MFS family permease